MNTFYRHLSRDLLFGISEFNAKITAVYLPDSITCPDTSIRPNKESGLFSPTLEKAFRELDEYLAGKRQNFTLDFELEGTSFQKAIWHAVANIPYGKTLSYGKLAESAGYPNAYRAAGSACHANPIPIFIPCHRVVAANGMGGYGGGSELKKILLELEAVY